MDAKVTQLHDFWFGPLDEAGFCAATQHGLWFTKSEATDATCRERFGSLVDQALASMDLQVQALMAQGRLDQVHMVQGLEDQCHHSEDLGQWLGPCHPALSDQGME